MNQREKVLLAVGHICGLIVGWKMRAYFVRRNLREIESDLSRAHLNVEAMTKVLNLLNEDEIDEAVSLWNEHNRFMDVIEDF